MRRGNPQRALALSVLAVLLAGCGRHGERDGELGGVTLAITPWPASAPIYVAYERGYFRDEGIKLTLLPFLSGHLCLEAAISGAADLATVGETPIARAVADGEPFAVITTICEIDQAILLIARKDRGISDCDDLKGKRIGVVRGTTADFFLHIYLTTSYIDPKSVQIVELAAGAVVDALLTGEVDAVSTWWPHTMALRSRLGDNAVVFHDPNIYTMTWDIVATRDLVKENPDRIKSFLRAIVRANRLILEGPDQTRAVIAKYIAEDRPLSDSEWADYRFAVRLDQSLVLNLEDQARWLSKSCGPDEVGALNFLDSIYADALKQVRPEAVSIAGK